MDLRSLYDRLERDPAGFPLFSRVWEVLQFAPSSRHSDEEERVSLAVDAFDYLQARGRWATASTGGRTELHWDGQRLKVAEDDDRGWRYHRTFAVGPLAGPAADFPDPGLLATPRRVYPTGEAGPERR